MCSSNKVTVAATNAMVCPLKLLRKLQVRDISSTLVPFIICGLHARLVVKNPHKTNPSDVALKYDQYMRYFSLWFGTIIGLSIQ